MIHDREENQVTLVDSPNPHALILGSSGYGKTYFLCRIMEKMISYGKKILILDYSRSFSHTELVRNHFQYQKKIRVLNPFEDPLNWNYQGDNMAPSLTDALVHGLGTESYYQKKLLREAIDSVLGEHGFFSFPCLKQKLESLLCIKEDPESRKNLLHLLTRTEPYSSISGIQFSPKDNRTPDGEDAVLTILQLSDYSESQRKFLVEFIAEVFWVEARCGRRKTDVIVLDEFQNMDMKPGSALPSMLREGRKFGLSVYLSSQFLGGYGREAVDTLMQAANKLFFRPTENDLKTIARLIAPNAPKGWEKILGKLRVGEAVLKGRYHINNNKKELETPIICKVEAAGDAYN